MTPLFIVHILSKAIPYIITGKDSDIRKYFVYVWNVGLHFLAKLKGLPKEECCILHTGTSSNIRKVEFWRNPSDSLKEDYFHETKTLHKTNALQTSA